MEKHGPSTASTGPVVLGLGSNLGDRRRTIEAAFEDLSALLDSFRAASLYETLPMYVEDQGPFLNSAVSGFFSGPPEELLDALHVIEKKYGRDRSRERRWGERSLDIDILLFGTLIVNEAQLIIPHPRLRERAFALVPLLELEAGARDPQDGSYYRDILKNLNGSLQLKAVSRSGGSRAGQKGSPFEQEPSFPLHEAPFLRCVPE